MQFIVLRGFLQVVAGVNRKALTRHHHLFLCKLHHCLCSHDAIVRVCLLLVVRYDEYKHKYIVYNIIYFKMFNQTLVFYLDKRKISLTLHFMLI